jgi:fibronectin-binding autotransporter adhesin
MAPHAVSVVGSVSDAAFANRPASTAALFANSNAAYSGLLKITNAGTYTFWAGAKDQFALLIDGKVIQSLNSSAGTTTGFTDASKPVSVFLSAGLHAISFKASTATASGGGQHLLYSGPDTVSAGTPNGYQAIAAENLYYAASAPEAANAYTGAARIGASYAIADGQTATFDTLATQFGAVITGTLSLGSGAVVNAISGDKGSLGAGWLGFAGTVNVGSSAVFNTGSLSSAQAGGALYLFGPVAQPATATGAFGGLTKRGEGALVLASGDNSRFLGDVNVSGGVLRLNSPTALPQGTVRIGREASTLTTPTVSVTAYRVTLSDGESTAGFAPGMAVTGTGGFALPAGTVVREVLSDTAFVIAGAFPLTGGGTLYSAGSLWVGTYATAGSATFAANKGLLVTLSGTETLASHHLMVGGSISGTGIPLGAVVDGVVSPNSFRLSVAGTGAVSGSLSAAAAGGMLDLNGQLGVTGNVVLNSNGPSRALSSSAGGVWNSSLSPASFLGTLLLGTSTAVGGEGLLTLGSLVAQSGTGTLTKTGANTLVLAQPNPGFANVNTVVSGCVAVGCRERAGAGRHDHGQLRRGAGSERIFYR